MVEYDPSTDGNAESDIDYLKPTKYILGSIETEGHTHVFYLRDDLPIATTANPQITNPVKAGYHAHSIEEGPGKTLICKSAVDGHVHTILIVDEPGDYEIRTLFTD